MAQRWLYGVDGGLQGSLPPWETDPWEDGVLPPSSDLGSLTEIVLIDGQVVDSRSRPVSGSGYECAALELGHGREPAPPRVERVVVREEPQEAMVHWLQRVVGGQAPLAGLDDRPLPLSEPLAVDHLSAGSRELARIIDEHLELVGTPAIVGEELLTAYRRLVVAAAGAGVLHLWREVPPERVTAAIIHCVVKANALTGAGAPFRVADFTRGLGVPNAPTSRSRSLALAVGGSQWPHGRSPVEAPEVYVLGDVGLLVSRFRNELITYRDLAWAAEAAQAEAAPREVAG
ncbi:MAG: hypothetical protein ACTMHL_01815 [Janibacter sp.]